MDQFLNGYRRKDTENETGLNAGNEARSRRGTVCNRHKYDKK
jgi:hypothetical protein